MNFPVILGTAFFYIVLFPNLVDANGRLLEPPCRSSIWRFPEFKAQNPPVNYNDNHLDCGGALVPEANEQSVCGVCGDPAKDPVPRSNEDGGVFSKGIIVRKYKVGQKIPVSVQLTYGQKGNFVFTLCGKSDPTLHNSPDCYSANELSIIGSKGNKFPVVESNGKVYNLTLQLPKDVSCTNCVLRWKYRTGSNWGLCGSGSSGALGCGPQTEFYGCSDIAIQN